MQAQMALRLSSKARIAKGLPLAPCRRPLRCMAPNRVVAFKEEEVGCSNTARGGNTMPLSKARADEEQVTCIG